MFGHILVPTDGSARSRKAAKEAVAFAHALGAKLTAYHGLEMALPYLAEDTFAAPSSVLRTVEKEGRSQAERYVAEVAKMARAAGVPCETYITRPGAPYRGIIDAARKKKCDAIFMASHGRGQLGTLILGSVTQKVLTHSKVPVVVYR